MPFTGKTRQIGKRNTLTANPEKKGLALQIVKKTVISLFFGGH